MTTEYIFDSGTDHGKNQLDYLSVVLDGPSRNFVGTVAPREGQRCIDLGAGNGSITRWLAERTGPTGEVHAVDLDTTYLDVPSHVRVHQHDINEGLPVGGTFDLVHARLLLLHLKRRREILAELVRMLTPGGWLVLGEFTRPQTVPLDVPAPRDSQLYHRMMETGIDKVGRPAGQDYTWAHEAEHAMTEEGLSEVDTIEYHHTARGGSPTCRLNSTYLRQMTPPLRELGIDLVEIDRFHELMLDPRMRIRFFPFVCVRGRKPL